MRRGGAQELGEGRGGSEEKAKGKSSKEGHERDLICNKSAAASVCL